MSKLSRHNCQILEEKAEGLLHKIISLSNLLKDSPILYLLFLSSVRINMIALASSSGAIV